MFDDLFDSNTAEDTFQPQTDSLPESGHRSEPVVTEDIFELNGFSVGFENEQEEEEVEGASVSMESTEPNIVDDVFGDSFFEQQDHDLNSESVGCVGDGAKPDVSTEVFHSGIQIPQMQNTDFTAGFLVLYHGLLVDHGVYALRHEHGRFCVLIQDIDIRKSKLITISYF